MSILKKSFDRITHTTMRVSILSLFLSLTLVAFSSTLAFLYYENYKTVSQLSKATVDLTSKTIITQVSDLLIHTQRIVQTSANLVHSKADISSSNQSLRDYMLETIRFHPNMPYLFVGDEEGDYLEAANLVISVQGHFLSDTSKPLPKETLYGWQFFKRSGDQLGGMTYYFDKDLKEIASEDVSNSKYDPRVRPWYIGAKKRNEFYWSDVYKFFDTGDPGISAAAPVRDSSGNLIGVFGADLSFRFLSKFFSEQTIGITGKPFIIDRKTGKIIIPEVLSSSPISEDIVSTAYQSFLKTKDVDFSFTKNEIRYLAHIEPFPAESEADWLVAIVVPFDDFFADLRKAQIGAFLIVLLICGLSSLAIMYFAKKLSTPIIALSQEVDKIKHLNLASNERIHSNIKEIDLMDSSIYSMKLAFRSFIHYVPRAIVEQLLSQNKEIALGGEKKEITVAFSDIADFTSITESLPTETLMPLLEEYFDKISKIILEGKGTIDKYIGDGIMAFWGAPLENPNHIIACAETILLCSAFVTQLNKERKQQGKPIFFTRFGINTGTAIVGNIGTTERMNYTLMGDTVNSASRLQNVNKIYHTKIIISEQVQQNLGDTFLVRPLDIVEVKGKKQKITIYELMGKKGAAPQIAPSRQDQILAEKFTAAYKAFHTNDLSLAKQLFVSLHQEFPQDAPTELYLKRLETL